jgi:hypothetical protein
MSGLAETIEHALERETYEDLVEVRALRLGSVQQASADRCGSIRLAVLQAMASK